MEAGDIAIVHRHFNNIFVKFLTEKNLYDHFLYGLKHFRRGYKNQFDSIEDYLESGIDIEKIIVSAFTWYEYYESQYGKKHPVSWEKTSREFRYEIKDIVKKKTQIEAILQALDVIN